MSLDTFTTIFYVDDDEDDRMFFEEVAQQIGESLSLFELGDDMLLRLKNPPSPSLIFLDLNMPVKDGFEVLHEIKSAPSLKNIPVIILSTAGNSETVQKCFDLGASLYLKKTVSISDLKKSIEYVLSIDWKEHVVDLDNFVYKG